MTRGSWFGSARGADGFTMIELLVASAIAIATTSAMIQLTRGAQGAFVAMNDLVDVQQKMRVAADAIQHDLAMAGAGSALPDGGERWRGTCRRFGRLPGFPVTPI